MKVEYFIDSNKFRQSSCGVQFFYSKLECLHCHYQKPGLHDKLTPTGSESGMPLMFLTIEKTNKQTKNKSIS